MWYILYSKITDDWACTQDFLNMRLLYYNCNTGVFQHYTCSHNSIDHCVVKSICWHYFGFAPNTYTICGTKYSSQLNTGIQNTMELDP